MVTQAVSRWKLQSACHWDGPADPGNRGCHLICAAAHEDRRFGTVGLAIVGYNEKERQLDLLRAESWKLQPRSESGTTMKPEAGQPKAVASYAELASEISAVCEPHKIHGLALNQTASGALWESLLRGGPAGVSLFDSPMGPAERRELAQNLVDAIDRGFLRIYRDENLFSQTAAMNIQHQLEGPVLNDPQDGTPNIERAMAFVVAITWAMRSLREDLGEL